MTAALNLGLLGNNVNTSGQVSLTAGVSGTLPVANGGTGATTLTANNVLLGNGTSAPQVVAPGTNGNVLTSNGTTWTSVAPVTAAPTTDQVLTATAGASAGAVGTYAFLARVNIAANTSPGSTSAGSNLRYAATGNTSVGAQITGSAPAGTWRAMGFGVGAVSANCGVYYSGTLWLRIS